MIYFGSRLDFRMAGKPLIALIFIDKVSHPLPTPNKYQCLLQQIIKIDIIVILKIYVITIQDLYQHCFWETL